MKFAEIFNMNARNPIRMFLDMRLEWMVVSGSKERLYNQRLCGRGFL